jgi:hypothetical protein
MRVIDLLEFAPTTPEEDERRLSAFPGQKPPAEPAPEEESPAEPAEQPVQQPAPAPQPVAQPVAQSVQQPAPVPAPQPVAQAQQINNTPIIANVVASKLKRLIADANALPDWEPTKELVIKLINTLEPDIELTEAVTKIVSPSREAVILAALKELEVMGLMKLDQTLDLAQLAVSVAKKKKVGTEFNKLEGVWQQKAEEITNSIFDKLEALANKVQGYTAIDEGTYKALTKAEKKVHDNAKNFAAVFKQAFFGMIMRMLSQNKELNRARIVEFLDACYNGEVIDMESLISQDVGNVKQHVNTNFEDMLDLFSSYGVFSWSPSKSSGAIGPGEMALSMMGSPAQKASHGGDLIVAGTNLEIKAGATSGGRLNSKKILKGPAAWPTWTEKITKIVRTAPAIKLKAGTEMGVYTSKTGEEQPLTKENYTPNTYNKNPKGHYKQGCVYNWSYKMLEKLNDEILIYSDYNKTYDLFYSTISKLITNLDDVSEPAMVNSGKGKQMPKLSADGKIAFPGVDAEELIGNAIMEDGTIIVPAMMEAYTKLAYASYNRADGVEAIMFLNTETLDYSIIQNGDDLADKMIGKGVASIKFSGGFHFNDDQQSATPAYLALPRSPKIEKAR